MITGPGTPDRSPPALSRTRINASSLVILYSFLATGQGPSLLTTPLSYIMSSPSSPSPVPPLTLSRCHDTPLDRDL